MKKLLLATVFALNVAIGMFSAVGQTVKGAAEALRQEILDLYPDAVTHRGQPMTSILKR